MAAISSTSAVSAVIAPLSPCIQLCIEKIRQIIRHLNRSLQQENNPHLTKNVCPISLEPFLDPVCLPCGHSIESSYISQLQNDSCPSCRKPLGPLAKLVTNFALRAILDSCEEEPAIVTYDHFEEDSSLQASLQVERYLTFAESCVKAKDYRGALELYKMAFHYCKSPRNYEIIPHLYDELQEKEKASLSRLYLSLYYLEEGESRAALKCLVQLQRINPSFCEEGSHLRISSLKLALSCEAVPTTQSETAAILSLIKEAPPLDKLFIYDILQLRHPSLLLQIYPEYLSLLSDTRKKVDLLEKVASLATDPTLQKKLHAELMMWKNAYCISLYDWCNASRIQLPPYPPEMQKFLAEDCPFSPGKKRSETHVAFPFFPYVEIDEGKKIPFTLESLVAMEHRVSNSDIFLHLKMGDVEETSPHFFWAVMTKFVIAETLHLPYDISCTKLPKEYQLPTAFDVARATAWSHKFNPKEKILQTKERGSCFTYCQKRLILGRFSSQHPVANTPTRANSTSSLAFCGIVGMRAFPWR